MSAPTDERTVVTEPSWARPLVMVGFPLLGGMFGWVLNLIADWIVRLPTAPFQGPIEVFTNLSAGPRIGVAVGVGVAAGLLLGLWGVNDMLSVTVDREAISARRGDDEQSASASQIASVFVEDKWMVVLGLAGEELVATRFDLDRDELRAALESHGYRWRADGDPYAGQYRLWVPDAEGLPAGANPVLKARSTAVEDDKASEASELRTELSKLGVVVRDKDKKQYWRLSGREVD